MDLSPRTHAVWPAEDRESRGLLTTLARAAGNLFDRAIDLVAGSYAVSRDQT